MIQPNELRIGNLILYLNELYVCDGIKYEDVPQKYRIAFKTLDGSLINEKMQEWINPVPLEFVLGFWCEKVQGTPFFEIDLKENIGQIHINPNNGTVWLKHHRTDSVFNPNSIHYAHQLQNLYFALTAKELELKKETA